MKEKNTKIEGNSTIERRKKKKKENQAALIPEEITT